jgi:hypothetical protein
LRVVAVLCARNEGENLFDTLYALMRQTHYLAKIIVVNDGLTEEYASLCWNLGCYVIYAPEHEESYVGKPELAKVWNLGLKEASFYQPDYLLLVGADHPLPPTYVADLLSRMKKDPSIVVASGRIEGEGFKRSQPRGSGRMVYFPFWEVLNNVQYPITYGWESWLLYSALDVELKCICFKDISAGSLTSSTRMDREKAKALGKGMYALGYYWPYALGRIAKLFLKSPQSAINMLKGWLSKKNVERLEVAEYVKHKQIFMLKEKAMIPFTFSILLILLIFVLLFLK